MRVFLENCTGSRWVRMFPYLRAQRDLQEGDLIHATFTVHRRALGNQAWTTGVHVRLATGIEKNAAAGTMVRLSDACRSSQRVLIHTLALLAISGETPASQTIVDSHAARERLLSAIQKLPHAEARLLLMFATTIEV